MAIPVALIAIAGSLEWVDNQFFAWWPFDRALFGWTVVVPTWLSPGIVAGFLWRSLSPRQTQLAAGLVTVVIGGAAALLYWQWIGVPFDCGFGTVTPAVAFLPPTLIVGLSVGAGVSLSSLLGTALVRAGVPWWWVAVVVSGSEIVMLVVAIFLGLAGLGEHTCYVPGPSFPVVP
ncbi:MAG: hypothetical protein ACRDGI_00530 [Candidatus Limnocylindrales bacterium]